MSYVVLARKWRPRQFEDVVGQQHVARTLKNSIEQDRVAHAYLFCGARGVGKTSMARILAKALNCEEGPTTQPCYECESCKEITEGQSVDVFEIDGASNRGINEIRELREGVRYAPSRDRYKVYIIDEVHMLTNEAFNALLKTLEEPPDHAQFIFATTEPQKIPVTILSRCQRFDFKRINQVDIVDHLAFLCEQEDIEFEDDALELIARQANGGMRDAISLLDQVVSFAGERVEVDEVAKILGVANREHLFEISDAILDSDAERVLEILDRINRYGYDLQQFAAELVNHLRDLVVVATVENPESIAAMTSSEVERATEQVEGIESKLLHRMFHATEQGAGRMKRSSHPKLIFEMTLVQLTEFEPLVGLDLIADRIEQLEGELEDDSGADVSPERPDKEKKKLTSETTDLSTGTEVDPSNPQKHWRQLVQKLKDNDKASIAAACEHIELYQFDNGVVGLEFGREYLDLFQSRGWLEKIETYLNDEFQGDWQIEWDIVDDSESLDTIANQRAEDLERRREQLQKEVEQNPLVQEARQLFEPEDEYTRVQLDDE